MRTYFPKNLCNKTKQAEIMPLALSSRQDQTQRSKQPSGCSSRLSTDKNRKWIYKGKVGVSDVCINMLHDRTNVSEKSLMTN